MSVTSPRSRNPRGQGDQLRVDLLDAAAELMAESRSPEAVSLRAVAARVGVSPTAVYRHFESHEDLVHQAVLWCWTEFERALDSAVDSDLDAFANFRRMGDAYARFAAQEPGKYSVIMTWRDLAEDTEECSLTVFAKLVDRVGEMLAANDDPRDPFFVATQVFAWMHGIVDICRSDRFPSTDELLDDLAVRLGLVAID